MAENSERFGFPLLQAGQAQKEIFHNEALEGVDALLHPVAQSLGDDDPPVSPMPGQCWIVGSAPTGAWSGHADSLACWQGGGWRFLAPVVGMLVWIQSDALWARFDGSDWLLGDIAASAISIGGVQVIGPQQAAITDPAGGATVDAQARIAIAAILSAIRTHGLIAT